MSEQRKEIGYFNTSTKHVIPGYSATYHALSAGRDELDDNGKTSFVENINGQPRELTADIKGQLMLDRERRGGERLWTRIYTEDDMVAKLEALGVQVKPDQKVKTIEQRANSSEAEPITKEVETKPEEVTKGENDLDFESVVDGDDAFDA